jgi:YesN/AraC family two-component response regulator
VHVTFLPAVTYFLKFDTSFTHRIPHLSHIFRIFSVISSLVVVSLKLYIKYMVSIRCKMVVKDELTKLGLQYRSVELGEADLLQSISQEQRQQFRAALLKSGLELMDDKKTVLIQKIKTIIIELVHYSEDPLSINLSVYLAEKLQHDYTYLANLFSEVQGTTIEKFFISHKIERVKELLVYSELTLAEIAYKMHYSSVAHLCTQFKKVTGLTPSHFKSL